MTYLRQCWYVAGHAEEATTRPLGRTLLDEPVVIYRTEAGTLVAMDDRCPHRFAPLHQGKVCGEHIECPYHGLRFSTDGACAAVPSGEAPPPRARVKTYPLVERDELLWIWMGDPALADPALIPDFSRLVQDDAHWWTGHLHANGNYQLLVDNLLDLSHVEFIHPILASPGFAKRAVHTIEQTGDTVTHSSVLEDDNVMPMALQMNPKLSPIGKTVLSERWDAPSVLLLAVDYYSATGSWSVPSGHFLTPETPSRTHYFLRGGQTVDKHNAEMTAGMRAGTLHIFQTEDVAMIEAQQKYIGNVDLMALQPVILRADAGAVRARRVLAKKIRDEQARQSQVGAQKVVKIAPLAPTS